MRQRTSTIALGMVLLVVGICAVATAADNAAPQGNEPTEMSRARGFGRVRLKTQRGSNCVSNVTCAMAKAA